MKGLGAELKIRTTCELSSLAVLVGCFLVGASIVSVFFVKTFIGAAVVMTVPFIYAVACFLAAKRLRNPLMMNVIDPDGVKNSFMGDAQCELFWSEIGDFGVAEVKKGLYSGKYIYMSRIFIQDSVKENIVGKYDPRVCIVFPYTEEVCRAVMKLSGGRIEVR